MRIVILGAPGSGKRTQTDRVADKYGLSPVMTGELVKTAVMQGSSLGLEIKELQEAGRVVTEDIILALLRERLLKIEPENGFILDGFPRNLLQALTLDELMIEIGQPLDLVLLIDIETDNLMERLVGRRTCRSCGLLYNIYRNPTVVDGVCDVCGGRLHQRSDDNEETVSSRIHVFDHLISSLITHYDKQGKLVRIDGNGEVDRVFSLICTAIDEGAPSRSQLIPPETEPAIISSTGREIDTRSGKEGNSETPTAQKSAQPAARTGKTTKKRAVPKKGSKKKSTPKKTAKKKLTHGKTTKKKGLPAKGSKKKIAAKKSATKKKASVKQSVKKQRKDSGSGSRAEVKSKPTKKGQAKTKKRQVKKGGSSAPKASVGKSKTSRIPPKGAAKKKQAKKSLPKKPVVKKVAKKKIAKKKASVKRHTPRRTKSSTKKKARKS